MLAFIHIEKAAGTTVFKLLRRSFGASHCDVEPWDRSNDYFSAGDYRKLRWLYPSLRSIAGHSVKPYSDLETVRPDVRYFTFVRDPLRRCASHYQFQVQKMACKASFEEWIQRDEFRNFMTRKLAGGVDLERATHVAGQKLIFVGVVERFSESFVMLRRALGGIVVPELIRDNVATDNSIRDGIFAQPTQRRLLEEANEIDAELYDFCIRRVWERQTRKWGAGLDVEARRLAGARPSPAGDARERLYLWKRKHVYKRALRWHRARAGYE